MDKFIIIAVVFGILGIIFAMIMTDAETDDTFIAVKTKYKIWEFGWYINDVGEGKRGKIREMDINGYGWGGEMYWIDGYNLKRAHEIFHTKEDLLASLKGTK